MKINSEILASTSDLDRSARVPFGHIDHIFEINLMEVEGQFLAQDLELLKDGVWSHIRKHVLPKIEVSDSSKPFRLHILVTGVPEEYHDAIGGTVGLTASSLISPEYTSIDVIGSKTI